MAIPFDNYFDAIGKVAGLTGKQVIDIATSEGNPAIWNILEQAGGPLNKWNVIYDEAGNVGSIITGNGQFFNFADDAVGAVTEYVGGNQLITDVAVSGGEMTVFTGDIIDAGTQTVTKKGLLAGATTGANILSGAFAALGGVMTGVKWYQDNPQFWTDLSQKLLPFAYDDPTGKSWSDILYEGLFPTAVDSDGTTYVQASLIEQLAATLNDNGFFSTETTATIKPDDVSSFSNIVEDGMNQAIAYNESNTAIYSEYASDDKRLYNAFKKQDYSNMRYTVQRFYSREVSAEQFIFVAATDNVPYSAYESYLLYGAKQNGLPLENDFELSLSYKLTKTVVNEKTLWLFYMNTGAGIPNQYLNVPETALTNNMKRNSTGSMAALLAYIMLYGNIMSAGDRPDNTGVESGATVPQAGQTLAETYPDWYKHAQTTVNPNSTPDNVQYDVWLPLTLPNTSNDTEGNTALTQEQAQQGKPSENAIESFLEWLQQAYQTQTLPQSETEQAGNSGTETEPPEPEDGGSAGVPVITGAANALWKIYNPSLATLQQFGAWLWSSDPIKMIKEIFSNQPIDGIIGLHAIYVTPQTGGAENIKVGYVDSGVPAPVVTSQYIRFSCGTIAVPLYYQNALDFAYTKVLIYLPFIGIEELDSYDVMGKTLEVVYSVDVLTGIVLAQIIVSAPNYKATLYQFNGSCGVEYPLSSGSRSSQMLSLITGAVGGAAIGGIGGAVLGGVRGAATGANVRMSGNLSGNAGAMGIRKPFIIVKRPIEIAASNYNEIYGYPANITGKLKTFSGFTRIKAAHVDNIPRATAAEKDRILSALQTGVII